MASIHFYIDDLVHPFVTLKDRATSNFFRKINEKYNTNFNCIFYNGRGYTCAPDLTNCIWITPEFYLSHSDEIEEFQEVYNLEEEGFSIKRKLKKYMVKLDSSSCSFVNNIPKEWFEGIIQKSDYELKSDRDDHKYKTILTEKNCEELEAIMEKCLSLRILV